VCASGDRGVADGKPAPPERSALDRSAAESSFDGGGARDERRATSDDRRSTIDDRRSTIDDRRL
jgi:hypothetical protein